jgi:hypothetical protein
MECADRGRLLEKVASELYGLFGISLRQLTDTRTILRKTTSECTRPCGFLTGIIVVDCGSSFTVTTLKKEHEEEYQRQQNEIDRLVEANQRHLVVVCLVVCLRFS